MELLVVVVILAAVIALILPAVRSALDRGEAARCRSNLGQLVKANSTYASTMGAYAPAAPDLFSTNRLRWHGARDSGSQPFRAGEGTLSGFVGEAAGVRRCGALRDVRRGRAANAFEEACGGYGYNLVGVGSRACVEGYHSASMDRGMAPGGEIDSPQSLVMFADAAFPQPYGNPEYLIEYSFVEPPYALVAGRTEDSTAPLQPSMHFRHPGKQALIAWADGHVDGRAMDPGSPAAGAKFNIGWFSPRDNSSFRPR